MSVENVLSVTPPSRASSLPHGACGACKVQKSASNPCGSELARESGGSACINARCADDSRASSLPHGACGACKVQKSASNPCGSEPARESGGSACINARCADDSRASSLPHGVCGACKVQKSASNPCGSEPARESGGSACINARCADAFASKLAPTWGLRCLQSSKVRLKSLWERACSRKWWVSLHQCQMCRRIREQARSHMGSAVPAKFKSPPQIPVGASLLAKVVGQLASMPNVPTHSRASSLPHGVCGACKVQKSASNPCGSEPELA